MSHFIQISFIASLLKTLGTFSPEIWNFYLLSQNIIFSKSKVKKNTENKCDVWYTIQHISNFRVSMKFEPNANLGHIFPRIPKFLLFRPKKVFFLNQDTAKSQKTGVKFGTRFSTFPIVRFQWNFVCRLPPYFSGLPHFLGQKPHFLKIRTEKLLVF